jgi:hypothetical protein
MTMGVGAGQMSRLDSARIASIKAEAAKLSLQHTVVASDAFFPFRDGLDVVVDAGATCVVQPGGSMRDQEVIDAANEHGVALQAGVLAELFSDHDPALLIGLGGLDHARKFFQAFATDVGRAGAVGGKFFQLSTKERGGINAEATFFRRHHQKSFLKSLSPPLRGHGDPSLVIQGKLKPIGISLFHLPMSLLSINKQYSPQLPIFTHPIPLASTPFLAKSLILKLAPFPAQSIPPPLSRSVA